MDCFSKLFMTDYSYGSQSEYFKSTSIKKSTFLIWINAKRIVSTVRTCQTGYPS